MAAAGPAGAVACRPRSRRAAAADQRRRICRECPRGHRQQTLREHARTLARMHAPQPLGLAAAQSYASCTTTTARASAQHSAGSRVAPRPFGGRAVGEGGMAQGRRSDSARLALRSTRPDGRPLHSRRAGSASCARSSSSSWDGRRFLSGARDGRVTETFVIVMGNSPYP